MKIPDKKIRAYALKNAIHYKGKPNLGAVISALFNEGLKKEEVKKIMPKIQAVIREISKLSLKEQKNEFEKFKNLVSEREIREGLEELPNVSKRGVVMRFAPSASGPMHVGHAWSSCLSFLYVKKYGGKFIVRIEDTNPENAYKDSYTLLEKDVRWLFGKNAEIVVQSDRMELYYAYAVALIEKACAYICTCSPEKFKGFADFKEDCPCRNNPIKENILRWEKMLKGDFKEGEVVLRFKSDMKHKNPAMRDFPLARVNETKHPRVGNKYHVWPLMNLSVAVDDIEMKMTHIIRGKDHRDNAERQKMIFNVFKKKFPWTGFLGRIHFKDMVLSKTKFREGIKKGIYSGWDDEKLPTIASLKKQNYKPEAFLKMAEHIGLSEVDKVIDKKEFFRLLKMFNK